MSGLADGFAINTYSYTQTMTAAGCLRHLARLGARDIELMIFPGHLWIDADRHELAEIRRIVTEEGLKLTSLNTTNVDLNIAGAAAEMRAYSLDMVEAFVRLAGELEAPGFILGPGKPNPLLPLPFENLRGHFFAALDRLLPVAQESGVELWAENMPFAFLPDLPRLRQVLDDYGASGIGICYDVANAHFIGEDPAAGLAGVGGRLKLVHISDTGRQVYRHDAIGRGDIDFAAVGQALTVSGHAKAPVLEIISSQPDADFAAARNALLQRGYFR